MTTTQHNNNDNNNNTIEATVQLDVDDKTRHGTYMVPAPYDGFNHRPGARTMKNVQIKDGRNNDALILDEAAFELVECPTALATEDFYKIQEGNEELTKKYHDEVLKFVKEKLGCDKVLCFNSQVRNENKSNGKVIGGGVNRYATGGPHTDNTPVSSDILALQILEAKKDATKYKRYTYMNLWRNISEEPIHNHPLAMMDERSAVKPDDYIAKDFITEERSSVQWGLSARHVDQHEWHYFPKMTKSEGILLKQVDSDFTKTGRTCFHMAVADPNAPSDAPPRESIELRMLCYWKETDTGVDTMPTKENIHLDVIQDPRDAIFDQSLRTASVLTLLKTIIERIPVVGVFIVFLLNQAIALYKFVTTKKMKNLPYTGNPEDYVDRFFHEIEDFPSQPKFVLDYAKSKLQGRDESEGIQLFTKALVDDTFHKNGTATFREIEKKEVVACLIKNEKYMMVAKKHLGKLM